MSVLIFCIIVVIGFCLLSGIFRSSRRKDSPPASKEYAEGEQNRNPYINHQYPRQPQPQIPKPQQPRQPQMPLKRKKILSPAETCFYLVLRQMLPPGKAISAKVRLEDIMFVPPCRNRFWFRQKINCRHVDFVVFNPKNGMVDFCIELDDSSHQERQDADRNKDSFFQSARIPLIRIPVQYTYDSRDVAKKILNVMRESESPYFMADYAYHWKEHFFQREREWR